MIVNNFDWQVDLVSEFVGLLLLQIICDMMGIFKVDYQCIFYWINVIFGFGDFDLVIDFDEFMQVLVDIGVYVIVLVEDCWVNYYDDLISSLVEVEVDGEWLLLREIVLFFILLVVVGNEMMCNVIIYGVLVLFCYFE